MLSLVLYSQSHSLLQIYMFPNRVYLVTKVTIMLFDVVNNIFLYRHPLKNHEQVDLTHAIKPFIY